MDDMNYGPVPLAILLAVFFVVGFGISQLVAGNGLPGSSGDKPAENKTEDVALSQDEVADKGSEYLLSQLPPFVRNASTVSITRDESIEGTEYMWDWQVALTVEPNSFGQWATNETVTRTENFYLSKNGEHIFFATPQSTDTQQQSPGALP